MSIPPELLIAYRRALYWVRTTPHILLRIDTNSEEARQLLEEYDADHAVLITSDNPLSQLRSEPENAFHREELQQDVIQSQCPFLLTASVDPSGQWPDEHGFLVFDLPLDQTHRLISKFEQWAVVWIEKQGAVSLLKRRVESLPESG